jgi:2-oxoglutarate ferredoxin oxidoreductase subunit delta
MRHQGNHPGARVAVMQRTPITPEPPPVLGDVHIHVERCKGCDLCVDYCPTTVLAMSDEFNPKGYHYPIVVGDNCTCCQACFTICPEFAIFATPKSSVDSTAHEPLTT